MFNMIDLIIKIDSRGNTLASVYVADVMLTLLGHLLSLLMVQILL